MYVGVIPQTISIAMVGHLPDELEYVRLSFQI